MKAGNVVLSSSSLGLHSREPLNTRADKIEQEFGEYFIGKGPVDLEKLIQISVCKFTFSLSCFYNRFWVLVNQETKGNKMEATPTIIGNLWHLSACVRPLYKASTRAQLPRAHLYLPVLLRIYIAVYVLLLL